MFLLIVTALVIAGFAVAAIYGSGTTARIAMSPPTLVALLALAGALAQHFPLHRAYQTKVSVDTAVPTSAVLLLDVPIAMVVAFATTAVDAVYVRRSLRVSWEAPLFNAAEAGVAVGASASAYHLLADRPIPPALPNLGSVAAVVAAVVVMHLLDTLLVATVGALNKSPTRCEPGLAACGSTRQSRGRWPSSA